MGVLAKSHDDAPISLPLHGAEQGNGFAHLDMGETPLATAPRRVEWGCHDSPLGPLLMGIADQALCRMEFASGFGLAYDLAIWARQWPQTEFIANAAASASLACQFYELNPLRWGRAPLALYGTAFQLKVWKALLQIEPGQLVSYDDIARFIGKPGSTRAVGMAVAANPIPMLIPCHRVMASDGSAGDYRWGRERRNLLLALEGKW